MLISIKDLLTWIVLIGAAIAVIVKLYKAVKILDKLHENDEKREKESKLLMKGVKASLEGLIQQGANGPVTCTLKEIEDYLLDK